MDYNLLWDIKNVFNNDFDNNKILTVFLETLEEGHEIIASANSIDYNNGGDKLEFESLIDLIQHYFSKDNLYHKELETISFEEHIAKKIYTSKGIVAVSVQNNDLYSTIEILLANLLCHNISIINFDSDRNYGTLKLIIDIINTIFFNLSGIKEVIYISRERYEQFENLNDNYDFMIYIGSNNFIKSRIYDCTIPFISYCSNEYRILYSNESLVSNIDENKLASLNTKLIKYSDIKDIVQKENSNFNYCETIFSSNNDDINYFANNIKSRYIFINSFPFVQRNIDIELSELMDIKVIFR